MTDVVITSEEEYEEALAEVVRYFDFPPDDTQSADGKRFVALAEAIVRYDEEN